MPSLATPPRRSRGRLAPRAPSLSARAQCTAHAANGAPGPASCGPPVPTTLSRPPMGPWPTAAGLARCPGYPLSDTHRSQPRSQPVNRAPAPLQMGFEPTFPPTAKRPPFCQFDYPPNSHYTDPGVPWAGITPPPNHSSHHAFHNHSIHSDPLASLTQHVSISLFHSHVSLNSAILLTTSPNYLVLPRHPLN